MPRLLPSVAALLLASLAVPSASPSAKAQEAGFETTAPFAYLKDLSTGTVLFSRSADAEIPPASMGKMMTVYVAFDMVKQGAVKLSDKIVVRPETWRAWHSQGSTMFLAPNQEVTVEELLHGIVTLSGNDACVVLAEGLAGTEPAFVDLMNETAERIGLTGSNFANTNGWPDPGEYVTPEDLATLAERTIEDFPDLYQQFYAIRSYTFGETMSGEPITQLNRNPLLGRVRGADGLKTGHTEAAGYGLTGSAEQDGRRLVLVVSGLSSEAERRSQAVALMEWGFRAFDSVNIAKAGTVLEQAEVHLGASDTVPLVAAEDVSVTIPRAGRRKVEATVRYNGPIAAPIEQGQEIAELVVTAPGIEPYVTPLVAGEPVQPAGPIDRILKAFRAKFFNQPEGQPAG